MITLMKPGARVLVAAVHGVSRREPGTVTDVFASGHIVRVELDRKPRFIRRGNGESTPREIVLDMGVMCVQPLAEFVPAVAPETPF